MPQDLMHILFEGVVTVEIKLMLKTFIYEKRFFDLDMLNSRLSSLDFDRKKIAGDSSLGLSGYSCKLFSQFISYIFIFCSITSLDVRSNLTFDY